LPLHHYASNYWMGMKKRLCLLALILQDSDIYIFDEPFNGLDLDGSLILKKWIKDNKNHKTTILSLHITSVLTEVCDEIHYIHAGRIVNKYVGNTTEEIEQDITDKFISVDR
jgi:ABC-2 type transport system ATP-binding protein